MRRQCEYCSYLQTLLANHLSPFYYPSPLSFNPSILKRPTLQVPLLSSNLLHFNPSYQRSLLLPIVPHLTLGLGQALEFPQPFIPAQAANPSFTGLTHPDPS